MSDGVRHQDVTPLARDTQSSAREDLVVSGTRIVHPQSTPTRTEHPISQRMQRPLCQGCQKHSGRACSTRTDQAHRRAHYAAKVPIRQAGSHNAVHSPRSAHRVGAGIRPSLRGTLDNRVLPELPIACRPRTLEEGYAVSDLLARKLGWPITGWFCGPRTPRSNGSGPYGSAYIHRSSRTAFSHDATSPIATTGAVRRRTRPALTRRRPPGPVRCLSHSPHERSMIRPKSSRGSSVSLPAMRYWPRLGRREAR